MCAIFLPTFQILLLTECADLTLKVQRHVFCSTADQPGETQLQQPKQKKRGRERCATALIAPHT